MLYKEFQGERLSELGLGCMRLPVKGSFAEIDQELTDKMVAYAMEKGINYYDTAWGYHDGMSEIAIGKALKAYDRKSFNLASKFPGYDLSNMSKVREIFEKQLEKCGVDYFDFYLFHNVCEINIDGYLNPVYGIFDYLMEQKKAGRIRHLGFSCHGTIDTMKRFLKAYGKDMEFCQIQLNWVDYDFQDAKAKVDLLNALNIPIWVMEPLRGGKLASLDSVYVKQLRALRPDETIPAWSFRYLQTIPGIVVTLSGMSDFDQLAANIATFETKKPLNPEEMAQLKSISDEMTGKSALPCTACRYCTTHCPMKIDIPYIISLYNEHIYTGGGFLAPMALSAVDAERQPSACVGCKSCEKVCPQNIKISEMMKDFVEKLG